MSNRISYFISNNRRFLGFILLYIVYLVVIEFILGLGIDRDVWGEGKAKLKVDKQS